MTISQPTSVLLRSLIHAQTSALFANMSWPTRISAFYQWITTLLYITCKYSLVLFWSFNQLWGGGANLALIFANRIWPHTLFFLGFFFYNGNICNSTHGLASWLKSLGFLQFFAKNYYSKMVKCQTIINDVNYMHV